MSARTFVAAAALGLAVSVLAGTGAGAQSTVSGPTVSLDRYEVAPGDQIVVTIDGFDTAGVTISVCGNEARRGSVDCNMPQSEGRGVPQDGTAAVAALAVYPPSVPCPCVIRVSTSTNDQVAVVPITIIGHPTAPVVNPDIPERLPLDVSIVVNESNDGFSEVARAGLGGTSNYDVTITVRNRTTSAVESFALSGFAGRNANEELITLDLDAPASLQAGETWRQTLEAEAPALTFGEVQWQVTASGAGPSVTATDTTRAVPWLLWLLGAILVIDLLILLVRFVMRMVRRNRQEPDDNPFIHDPDAFDPNGSVEAKIAADQREPHLVS